MLFGPYQSLISCACFHPLKKISDKFISPFFNYFRLHFSRAVKFRKKLQTLFTSLSFSLSLSLFVFLSLFWYLIFSHSLTLFDFFFVLLSLFVSLSFSLSYFLSPPLPLSLSFSFSLPNLLSFLLLSLSHSLSLSLTLSLSFQDFNLTVSFLDFICLLNATWLVPYEKNSPQFYLNFFHFSRWCSCRLPILNVMSPKKIFDKNFVFWFDLNFFSFFLIPASFKVSFRITRSRIKRTKIWRCFWRLICICKQLHFFLHNLISRCLHRKWICP